MTFYHFVMKILRRFHHKYALGTSNYLLLGRGEWWVLLGRWLSYSFYRFYSTSPENHVITPKSSTPPNLGNNKDWSLPWAINFSMRSISLPYFSVIIRKLSVRGSSESEIINFRFGISPASHTIRDLAALDQSGNKEVHVFCKDFMDFVEFFFLKLACGAVTRALETEQRHEEL